MTDMVLKKQLTGEDIVSLMALRATAWNASGIKFKPSQPGSSMLSDDLDFSSSVEQLI